MHSIGKIDREIYKCITEDIRTDEVIITDNQIQHIKDRHPDYIVETPKPNTALILKEIITEKKNLRQCCDWLHQLIIRNTKIQ